jgi:hypothetical protein
MSNIFKTNSRFAGLSDDIPPAKKDNKKNNNGIKKEIIEEKINSFKSENNTFKNDGFRERSYNRYNNQRERLEAEEKAKKMEEELKKSFTIDNYPELVSNKKENVVTNQEQTYIEKLKKINEVKDENKEDEPELKEGWISIKRDKSTNKLVIKSKTSVIKNPEILEEEIAINVINVLVDLHERRTEEYIELNGYDAWEKNFKFPDWREREADLEEDDSDEEYDDEYEDSEEEYM